MKPWGAFDPQHQGRSRAQAGSSRGSSVDPEHLWMVLEDLGDLTSYQVSGAHARVGPMAELRKHRSPVELSEAIVHVQYEIRAFVEGAQYLLRHQNDERWIESLEADLLHARALLEFLGARGRHSDKDIAPADFGASWSWPSTSDAARLERVLDDIDKYLSHLSWARVAFGDPGVDAGVSWRPMDLVALMSPILRDVSRAIREVHPDFADRLDIPLGMYPPLGSGVDPSFSTTNPPVTTTTSAKGWSARTSQ